MAGSRNRVEDSSAEATNSAKPKLKKFYPFAAGNTKDCHETIVRKLKQYGARQVESAERSKVVLVFCPIVSRFETDINAALSELQLDESKKSPKVIIVAMHHTHKADYTVPPKRKHSHNGAEVPVVHCLFHETKGLLQCPANKQAVKTIRKEMVIKKYSDRCSIL